MANADGLREELQRAFRELESTVKEGRHRIDSEQSRQLRVRQSNLASLSNNLNELRRDHSIHVETLVRSKLKSFDSQCFDSTFTIIGVIIVKISFISAFLF